MRRSLSTVWGAAARAAVGLAVIAALPVLLVQATIDWVRGCIEDRWPDSRRAQEVSFWIGFLWPFVLTAILAAALLSLLASLPERQGG